MIPVTSDIAIDEKEILTSFVRASGPGGQNVNKVASAVQLRFDVIHSPSLPEDVRERLLRLAAKRINSDGILTIDARQYRTQEQNRQDALNRLIDLIRRSAEKPKTRRTTKPTLASRRRRLDAKRRKSSLKVLRRTVRDVQ